ncbi:hypothetical protein [uncultured Duncaniella sp.]|uniref:hypothetical protein n=1 Tax=uncultured Duncaniella sp. TaxID=2768039 RepID=UPI00265FE855|nr:hypothetical protein [uncultured Duncaniella sp.]
MKRFLYAAIILFCTIDVFGETLSFGDSLKITIPEKFTAQPDSMYSYMGYGSDGSLLIVKRIDVKEFNGGKAIENGDEFSFNLRDYDRLSSESEGFFDFGHDYKMKTYRHSKNGQYLYTYTSYMYNFPYVILYGSSSKADDDKTLSEIVSTIEDGGDTWWHRFHLLFSRCWGPFILISLIMAIIVSASKSNIVLIATVGLGAWMFSPAWGDWTVYGAALLAYALLMLLMKVVDVESLINGIAEGIGD